MVHTADAVCYLVHLLAPIIRCHRPNLCWVHVCSLGFELKHASHPAARPNSCACSLSPELRVWPVADRGLKPWLSQGVALHL